MSDIQERIAEVEAKIAELKAHWPAHSVQPWLLEQLEELEDELEALQREQAQEFGQGAAG